MKRSILYLFVLPLLLSNCSKDAIEEPSDLESFKLKTGIISEYLYEHSDGLRNIEKLEHYVHSDENFQDVLLGFQMELKSITSSYGEQTVIGILEEYNFFKSNPSKKTNKSSEMCYDTWESNNYWILASTAGCMVLASPSFAGGGACLISGAAAMAMNNNDFELCIKASY